MRSVPIRSIVGQVQYYLNPILRKMNVPEKELLLTQEVEREIVLQQMLEDYAEGDDDGPFSPCKQITS